MRIFHAAASLLLGAAMALSATPVRSAEVTTVTAADLHLDQLRPTTQTYLVYFHGGPGSGIKRSMLASSQVTRETADGADAWVIEQSWEGEDGIVHTAHTVHAAKDVATLAQSVTWNRPTGSFTTSVVPAEGRGTIEGAMPDASRERAESGFATMQDGWWLNWHSDLVLLPLLPFERGGTLRVHLFDVGMPGPMDVDYTVLGERTLPGGDGNSIDCWLVETDSGSPGSGSFQRFWIDKARRVVVKEEDVFNGQYRSKILLSVPAVTEFEIPDKS